MPFLVAVSFPKSPGRELGGDWGVGYVAIPWRACPLDQHLGAVHPHQSPEPREVLFMPTPLPGALPIHLLPALPLQRCVAGSKTLRQAKGGTLAHAGTGTSG